MRKTLAIAGALWQWRAGIKKMLWHPFAKGRLAQLVEHLVYTERVSGSSPLAPTTHF